MSDRSVTPNASEVRFTDAGGVLKTEAKQPIEADVRHPNQGKRDKPPRFRLHADGTKLAG
jgi:hypothetical protein